MKLGNEIKNRVSIINQSAVRTNANTGNMRIYVVLFLFPMNRNLLLYVNSNAVAVGTKLYKVFR